MCFSLEQLLRPDTCTTKRWEMRAERKRQTGPWRCCLEASRVPLSRHPSPIPGVLVRRGATQPFCAEASPGLPYHF